ncbi:MAG: hypothetical protein LBH38_03105 [Holosporales bacterium]|nr:hypothetical protein [Holosporales bacterium]
MGTIVHLDDYRHRKKWPKQDSAQSREQTLQMKPLGRRKSAYPELQKKQKGKDLPDPPYPS